MKKYIRQKPWGMYWLLTLLSTAIFATPEVHYEQYKQQFSYLGTQYQGTTDKNNTSNQWCYLKQTIDGSSWGNVRAQTIPKFKTMSGQSCNAPSSYQGDANAYSG